VAGYVIEIAPAVLRQLKKLAPVDRATVAKEIDHLASQPRPSGSRVLAGAPRGLEWRRIRAGSWRVIYQIEDDQLLVLVLRVGDRKEVYRRLERLKQK